MSIFVRWLTLLMLATVCFISGVLFISPMLDDVGIIGLTGYGMIDQQTFQRSDLYIDYDTGLMHTDYITQSPNRDTIMSTSLFFERHSNNEVYALSRESNDLIAFVVSFDGFEATIRRYQNLEPIAMDWYVRDESLLVVHNEGDDTIFSVMDIDTGMLSELRRIHFSTGFVHVSPDNRYMLLREYQDDVVERVIEPKPMQLLDLGSDFVLDLGAPAFAFWSPDSRYLALGYESDITLELDVQIYDIQNDIFQDTGLRASQEDMPFFYNPQGTAGILWSSDSQSLAILNEHQGLLYQYQLDGETQIIEVGRLQPKLWSPDARYLLTIGYDREDVLGAYIIDFNMGTISPIQSQMMIGDWVSNFVWSYNSRSIVVMLNRQFWTEITIYNTQGELIRETIDVRELLGNNTQIFSLRSVPVWDER